MWPSHSLESYLSHPSSVASAKAEPKSLGEVSNWRRFVAWAYIRLSGDVTRIINFFKRCCSHIPTLEVFSNYLSFLFLWNKVHRKVWNYPPNPVTVANDYGTSQCKFLKRWFNKSVEKDPENHLKHSEPRLDELTTSLPSKWSRPVEMTLLGAFPYPHLFWHFGMMFLVPLR